MTRAALLIAAVAVALVTNACDSSESDRAGGENPAEPPAGRATTLTLANVNSEPEVLQVFAERVEDLSGGTLRIRFENSWGQGRRGNAEVNVIHDVKAGKADLGWAGSRAFDLVGDRAFGPLHAPMMIDSYALELKVLQDEGVVRPMLESLDQLGLEDVGVLPGPLRRPLGVRRLAAPPDWSGMRIGHAGGEQIARSLRALGARPRIIVSSGEFAGFDGVESHVTSIAGNEYHHEAPYLTGNVVLWPRPLVLFAGHGVTRAQLPVLQRGSPRRGARRRRRAARVGRRAARRHLSPEPEAVARLGERARPPPAGVPARLSRTRERRRNTDDARADRADRVLARRTGGDRELRRSGPAERRRDPGRHVRGHGHAAGLAPRRHRARRPDRPRRGRSLHARSCKKATSLSRTPRTRTPARARTRSTATGSS